MAEKTYRALVNVLTPKGLVAPGKTFRMEEEDANALPDGACEPVKAEKPSEPAKT
jgi:hypothetical protein